ncbi:MAG: lactonase family protein [Candidatus Berkiella sp.]
MKTHLGAKIKVLLFCLFIGCFGTANAGASTDPVGAVFVSSNSSTTNSVHMYLVSKAGDLSEVPGSPFSVLVTPQVTGSGSGPGATLAGDPLASQYSLIVDKERKLLFVVNAGSGSVSSFQILQNKLVAADTKPSGGLFPVSLTYHDGILYVVNTGNTANIQGFFVNKKGKLIPIPKSNIPLPYSSGFPVGSQGQPQIAQIPGQISFSPSGKQLLVLGKEGPDLRIFGLPDSIPLPGVQGPGHLFVYQMGQNGVPKGDPTIYTFPLSPCMVCDGGAFMKEPFSFTFVGPYVVVVEFFGNSLNGPNPFEGSAVSSFKLMKDGTLDPISVSVPSNQGGVCWIVLGKGNRLYTANDLTDNISLYSISSNGGLTLENASAGVVGPGAASFPDLAFPLDIAIGNKGRTLYQLTPGPLNAPGAQIHAFSIHPQTGQLTAIGTTNVGTVPLNGQMGMATLDFDDSHHHNNGKNH